MLTPKFLEEMPLSIVLDHLRKEDGLVAILDPATENLIIVRVADGETWVDLLLKAPPKSNSSFPFDPPRETLGSPQCFT